jgi:alpha-beta hydrolase superfamily lysophospholipase
MKRIAWLILLTSALSGCAKLDGFLYTPERTNAYEFKADGEVPAESVDPARIEAFSVPVDADIVLGAVKVAGNTTPPRGVLLYFHGKGDHLDGPFSKIKRLANMGFDVYAVDYRGWGISTNVKPTEAGINEDTLAFYNAVIAREGSADRIVFYGNSFGAAAALQRSVTHAPKVLFLEAPFASIQDFIRDSSQLDLPQGFITHDSWNNVERISQVHSPVFIMHGLKDDFVRPEFAEKLYAHANEPKQLLLVPEAMHDVAGQLDGDFAPTVLGFTDAHLPPL